MSGQNTINDFEVGQTVSDLWDEHPSREKSSSISFLYVDDLGEAPDTVLTPLVSFPSFVEHKRSTRLVRDGYSVKKRFLDALTISKTIALVAGSVILGLFIISLFSEINMASVLTHVVLYTGICSAFVFLVTALMLGVGKYTNNIKDKTVSKVFKPITVQPKSAILPPALWTNHDEPVYKFNGLEQHYNVQDDELYEAVSEYVKAVIDAKVRGEEDTESESLYIELADFVIDTVKLDKSQKLVQGNPLAQESLSEEHNKIIEDLDVRFEGLLEKFNQARQYYQALVEDRMKEESLSILL